MRNLVFRSAVVFSVLVLAGSVAWVALANDEVPESNEGSVPPATFDPGTDEAESIDTDTIDSGTVGVIGCSNTDQHVSGYLAQSSADFLVDVRDLGGGSREAWYTNENDHWGVYEANEPPGGYQAVWIQVCLKSTEHDGTFTTTTPPPQRDINGGVLIMLLGVLFTSGVVLLGNVKPAGRSW